MCVCVCVFVFFCIFLKALSSRLCPASGRSDVSALEAARFVDSFLSGGGLPLLLTLLKDKAIAAHVDAEIQREVISRTLQLLK